MSDHPNITRKDAPPIVRGASPRHEKSWGHEIWIANSELYCGKKLTILPNKTTSIHFHVKKTEHVYIGSGTLELTLIENTKTTVHTLEAGDWIFITPGLVHGLANTSEDYLVLFEFSTQHFNNDSYRIER